PHEQSSRMVAMRRRLKIYDINSWTKDFFIQLSALGQENERLSHTYLKAKAVHHIHEKFIAAQNPILFLDFDGTLVPLEKNPQNVRLPEEVKETLLAISTKCTIVIVSGRERS